MILYIFKISMMRENRDKEIERGSYRFIYVYIFVYDRKYRRECKLWRYEIYIFIGKLFIDRFFFEIFIDFSILFKILI